VYPDEYIVAYLAELPGYESMYTSKGSFGLTYNQEMIWPTSIAHVLRGRVQPSYSTTPSTTMIMIRYLNTTPTPNTCPSPS